MMLMKAWWAFSWAPSPTGLFGWPAVPSTRGAKSEVKRRSGPGIADSKARSLWTTTTNDEP